MSIAKDQRITITIPYPSRLPRGKGINAVTNGAGGYVRFDCSTAEQQAIDEAALHCTLTRSAFMRWIAIHVAKEINRVYQDDPEPVPTE